MARCPAHDDGTASLSISEGSDGRTLLKCHAGCDPAAVVAAAGLTMPDLFVKPASNDRPRITVAQLAAAKGLPVDVLTRHGVKDLPGGGVLIPYRREDGSDAGRQRLRHALAAKDGSKWTKGHGPIVPYGLSCLAEARKDGRLIIAEGESDCWTLQQAGLPALGIPGVEMVKALKAEHVRSISTAYVMQDRDGAGAGFVAKMGALLASFGVAHVYAVPMPEGCKDPNDVYRRDPNGFKAALTQMLAYAATATPAASGDGEPINLSALLGDVETFIRTYVVLSPEQAVLLALWAALTHALDGFEYVPYVNIKSPMPECGKTRLLEVLESLVANPWLTGRVTAAVLMRKVDAEHPTLLLDESDAAFSGEKEYAEALRGLLNSGFHRSGKASACVGQGANLTYKDFGTFGAKAIAGIGTLPATVVSRSIPVALKRRTKGETVAKWRRRAAWEAATPLRQRLATAMRGQIETLRSARPVFPDGLSDRAEDVLEPLFAIADLAGDGLSKAARAAAVALMGLAARVEQEADQAIGLQLLADVQRVFEAKGNPSALSTKDLLGGLCELDDCPWATFARGDKPIAGYHFAKLVKGFDAQPGGNLRFGGKVWKGYRFDAFADAFARYLPSEALQRNNVNETGPKVAKTEALHGAVVALPKTAVSPDKHWDCYAVAPPMPDHERKPGSGDPSSRPEQEGADGDSDRF